MASEALARATLDMLLAVVPADDPDREPLVAQATAMAGAPRLLDGHTPMTGALCQVTWTFGSDSSRVSSPVRTVASPKHGTSTNGHRDRADGTVPCIVCGAKRRGPGDDCFLFSVAHAPGTTMVVCAQCIFTEAAAAETAQHPLRDIVEAYQQ